MMRAVRARVAVSPSALAVHRATISTAREVRRSGLSESEWMARSHSYIDGLVKSGEYPIFTRIAMEAHQPHLRLDPPTRFCEGR